MGERVHRPCHFGSFPAHRGHDDDAYPVALALAGCATAPEAVAPPPPPTRAAPPPPSVSAPRSSNWEDWRATPGDWGYRKDARGSIALFGQPGTNALFVVRCDQASARIYMSRSGSFPVGQSGQMTVRTSSTVRTLSAGNSNESPPYIASELLASDRLLDAMAYSRGKFVITVRGADDLVIPTWAEFARVVEDCRAAN